MLDLEEMLLRVRSVSAREDMREAVACYNAGAHRAAIVVTWTAVVYDIMSKLRELELTGDKKAGAKVATFEAIRAANDVKRSQEWERDILAMARDDFELLTHQEHADLERLRGDRHRCAHPAMDTMDDPYRPPSELVRYHLRSALVHLLVQAPVQGKAALARLATEVRSSLFPSDPERAVELLKVSALQRPKDALLRDFLIGTIKESLTGPDRTDPAYQRRLRSALVAVSRMHPSKVKTILADRLPDVLRSVPEADFGRMVHLADALDDVWVHTPADVRVKLEQFLAMADVKRYPGVILKASQRTELAATVLKRIAASDMDEVRALVKADRRAAAAVPSIVERAVELLEQSSSWANSNNVIEFLLEPLVAGVSNECFARIAQAAVADIEVRDAHRTSSLLRAVRDLGTLPSAQFNEIAEESGLTLQFPELMVQGAGDEVADGSDVDRDRPWMWSLHDGFPDDAVVPPGLTYLPGERVVHPRYEHGAIKARTGTYGHPAVDVEFDRPGVGRRNLVVNKTILKAE